MAKLFRIENKNILVALQQKLPYHQEKLGNMAKKGDAKEDGSNESISTN